MSGPEFTMSQLLPHTGRMLMIDELLACDEQSIVTAVTIRPDSVLCDGVTGVPAWVGMEYMAQAACACSGVEKARSGLLPGISLLLGTRSYKTSVPVFALGSRLTVAAQLLVRDDDDLAVFSCQIHDADTKRELAVGDIKAIRPKDLQALIREQLNG